MRTEALWIDGEWVPSQASSGGQDFVRYGMQSTCYGKRRALERDHPGLISIPGHRGMLFAQFPGVVWSRCGGV
ncbi:protein of unknown function [Kyrpidia spormannii]|uniref:Uncharacterized protein n=2 Tax=Kyrpidia spormannii TaxID=2055160 RepID=A0ACA8Z9P1_9BACL|nr:protein of unknown function [Kyrpidia spormannii]CAB3393806.1 protein of unknown function [Kyrpidia spormannii]